MPIDRQCAAPRTRLASIGCAAVLVLLGTRYASSEVKGTPAPPDPIAQLNQRLDALTQRVRQLELGQANFQKSLSKPDVPDDAGESTKKALAQAGGSSGKGSADGGGSSSGSGSSSNGNASDGNKDPPEPPSQGTNLLSITQRVTALENRHSVTAPFNVIDGSGKLIFRVEDAGNGGGRGTYVFDSQGHLIVAAYGDSGGRVDTLDGSDSSTRARLSTRAGEPSVSLMHGGDTLAELVAVNNDEIELNLNANGRPRAGVHAGSEQASLYLTGPSTQAALVSKANSEQLILGPGGSPAVEIDSDSTGGFLRIGKPGAADSTYTKMAANKDGLGLVVRSGGTLMDYVGLGNDGNNGQMGVYGAGKIVAAMQTYDGGKGQISVFNSAGMPIAFIAESDKHPGGGNMTAADPSGNGVFSAGFTGGTSGDACLDLKGAVLKCLGIGLPLAVQ